MMALDPETRAAIREIGRELVRQRREIASLKRGQRRPQLAHSSLESGQSVEVRDEGGAVRARIGWQPDGTTGLITEGGDEPPAPSAPTVEPSLGGLRVTWDGDMANDVAKPSDLGFVQVHVSTTSGFTPDETTRAGSIPREGGIQPVMRLPYEEHYVRLVGVTTGGVTGAPSTEAAATPERVDGPDLVAGSVTTAHIQAGAITADLLEAILVLATRVLVGDPNAARIELDGVSNTFRTYNASEELTVDINADTGDVTITGNITGSLIEGSDFRGGSIIIGDDSGGEHVSIGAVPTLARINVVARSGSASEISADDVNATVRLQPPDEVGYTWTQAELGGFVHDDGDVYPFLALISPNEGGTPYSSLELAGGSSDRSWSEAYLSSDTTTFELGPDTTQTDGFVDLAAEMSLVSPRHQPERSDMAAEPDFATGASFVDFSSGEMPAISFRTSNSGHVRVTITAAGYNSNTATSSLALGFRLSGGSTVAADLARAWYQQGQVSGNTSVGHQSRVVYLQLEGDADYTLTPAWRISSGSSSTARFHLSFENSIVVEPLP